MVPYPWSGLALTVQKNGLHFLWGTGHSRILYWTKCGSEVFASAYCGLWMERRLLIQKNNEQIVRSVIYQQIHKMFIECKVKIYLEWFITLSKHILGLLVLAACTWVQSKTQVESPSFPECLPSMYWAGQLQTSYCSTRTWSINRQCGLMLIKEGVYNISHSSFYTERTTFDRVSFFCGA